MPADLYTPELLQGFVVHGNMLRGNLPDALHTWYLDTLDIGNNYFSGDLSTINMTELFSLQTLDLSNNLFEGTN